MIGFRVTDITLDPSDLLSAMDRSKARGLKIVGFETRQEAMNSMKATRITSRPGSPPNSHDGTLKEFTLYSADKTSMVAGPKFLRKKSRDVASALEKGGTTMNTRGRLVHIEPRPFMVPAFERVNREKVPAVFANSVY